MVYIFRDIAELSYAEIAEVVEKKEPAVRQIITRAQRTVRNFLNNNCSLYNPQGECNCKYQAAVQGINLADEYQKLGRTLERITFLQRAEMALPRKNYWEKLL
jgi:RNA polymerase sigma-70 factor (ECF subfamily)